MIEMDEKLPVPPSFSGCTRRTEGQMHHWNTFGQFIAKTWRSGLVRMVQMVWIPTVLTAVFLCSCELPEACHCSSLSWNPWAAHLASYDPDLPPGGQSTAWEGELGLSHKARSTPAGSLWGIRLHWTRTIMKNLSHSHLQSLSSC